MHARANGRKWRLPGRLAIYMADTMHLFAMATVAQLAARRSHDPKVVISILTWRIFDIVLGISLSECQGIANTWTV